ncbi:hypothetical protein Tco_1479498, partial [Tanacetum coccineum]
ALCSDYDDVMPSDTYSVQAPSGGVTILAHSLVGISLKKGYVVDMEDKE